MLDDFEPILHTLPGRSIKVWAVADVHLGAKEADERGFRDFLRRIQEDEDSYLVICGDLINNATRSSVSNIFEDILSPSEEIELAVELLKPVADRILGCVAGNHENRSVKDTSLNPLYIVMGLLGKERVFRPNLAFIRVTLREGRVKDQYSLLLFHGKTANKRKQFDMVIEGVDATISGHLHDGNISKPARMVFSTKNNVVVKPMVSLTAVSWLSYSSYASQGLLLPKSVSDPQCLLLEYTGSNSEKGKISVSW